MNRSNDNLVDKLPNSVVAQTVVHLARREPAAVWRSAGPISGPVGGEYAE